MTCRTDLEGHIRESYQLIHKYEEVLRLSDGPKEQARARRAIGEQWELIKGYLAAYAPLCKRLNLAVSADIADQAAKNRAVYFLLHMCTELEQPEQ